MWRRAASVGWALMLGAACGSAPSPDAGADDGAARPDAPPWAPTPVAPPEAPRMACPTGWATRALEGGATACDPWPGGRLDCGPTELQLPGTTECVPLGSPCPDGDFPDPPASGGAWYVRAGATGGDGSRRAPFGTVTEAVAAAADGDVVWIAAGIYEGETIRIERPLTLRGTCLDAILGARTWVTTDGPGVRIENLRVQGAPRGPLAWSGDLTLRGVAIVDVAGAGVSALTGATADLEDVSVRDARFDAGVMVGEGSALVGRRLSVVNASNTLLLMAGGASATLEDVAFTQRGDGAPLAELLRTSTGVSLSVSRGVFESEQGDSMFVNDSTLTFRDVSIRGPEPGALLDEPPLLALGDARVDLGRVWLRDMHVAGMIFGAGASLIASDVVISDVHDPVAGAGYGVVITDGASGTFERLHVERATRAGVLVTEAGTRLVGSDLRVRDTRPGSDGFLGRGIQVQREARFEGGRVEVADVREAGVIVASDATATLRDLVVTGVAERACAGAGVARCDGAGIGLAAYLGGAAVVERFRVSAASLAGFQIAVDGSLDLSDGEVSENPVGVNLQVAEYDLGRLTTRVRYRDNGVNLDATELAVPAATTPGVLGM